MADQDILEKSRHYLIESFESGGGEAARAQLLGGQLTQLLLAKHDGQTSAEFRDDVRQYGLALRKDNPGLRDALMYNEASLQTVVENGREGLRSEAQREAIEQMKSEAQKEAIGVDDMHPLAPDDEASEGEIKGRRQPRIAGQAGIEYDTGDG